MYGLLQFAHSNPLFEKTAPKVNRGFHKITVGNKKSSGEGGLDHSVDELFLTAADLYSSIKESATFYPHVRETH